MSEISNIAYNLNTLPRFLEKKTEYIDWLKLIKNIDYPFEQIVHDCTLDIKEELLQIYIANVYEVVQHDRKMRHIYMWQLEEQFGKIPPNNQSLQNISRELQQFRTKMESFQKHQLTFQKTVHVTDYVIEKITYILETNLDAKNVFMNFNLDKESPIILYNDYVHCLDHENESKNESKNESIQLPNNIDRAKCYILYNNIWFVFSDSLQVYFELKNLNNKSFIHDAIVYFKEKLPTLTLSIKKNLFKGYFLCANTFIEWINFLDHIMLNKNLNYIVYDEKTISSKEWYSLKIFMNEKEISLNVSQKQVVNNSKAIQYFGIEKFPMNSFYVKCNFNNIFDLSHVESVRINFGKVVHYINENNVIDEYRKILPNCGTKFKTTISKEIHTNKQLKQIVPEMFVINYPRKCLHLPRILADHEDTSHAILFPTNGEPTKPRWYGCDHHANAPYPGLRRNPLKNKDKFPYLPCCYISNQQDKPGSELRKYYNRNEETRNKYKKLNDNIIYVTNRILPDGAYGVLPKQLEPLFYDKKNELYYRYGLDLPDSGKSMLECLSFATEISQPSSNWLLQNSHYALQEKFMTENVYRRMLRLLEQWYDCNIVVFVNDRDATKMMKINKSDQYYTQFSYRRRTVYILENKGLVADENITPKYELLCRGYKDDSIFIFSLDESLHILRIYDTLNNITRLKPLDGNLKLQYISKSGIVHRVNVGNEVDTGVDKGNEKIFLDPPHPPYFNVPFVTDSEIKDNSIIGKYNSLLEQFETLLIAHLEGSNVSVPKSIVDFASTLSKRRVEYILKHRHFFNIPLCKNDGLFFKHTDDYLDYCKYQSIKKFNNPKILNNKILYLERFDSIKLHTLQNWILYSISEKNSDYIKIYSYTFTNDKDSKKIINIDNDWYIAYDDWKKVSQHNSESAVENIERNISQ